MKRIPLTQGKFALVDDADFEWLSQWKWHAVCKNGKYYAVRKQYLRTTADGKEVYDTLYMARVIMRTLSDCLCDHKDGNGLNDQRSNLRNCTKAENQRNRGPQRNNTSGQKNITWHSQNKMWRVRVSAKGQLTRGGLHHRIEDAIRERNKILEEMHGDFARVEAFYV